MGQRMNGTLAQQAGQDPKYPIQAAHNPPRSFACFLGDFRRDVEGIGSTVDWRLEPYTLLGRICKRPAALCTFDLGTSFGRPKLENETAVQTGQMDTWVMESFNHYRRVHKKDIMQIYVNRSQFGWVSDK